MTTDDFFDLVARMREAQREYFRTRSPTVLERSKALERAVDNELREHANQPSLFPMEKR